MEHAQEEWTVAVTAARQVVTGHVSEIPGRSHFTICDDEAEARRVAGAISKQIGLPQWGCIAPDQDYLDASEFVDVEADGPDPYAAFRNAAQGNLWAVVLFHDERYAKTDFPCVTNLDEEDWQEQYIVSRHPSEVAAAEAAAAYAQAHGLEFPVEPGQFSLPVPAAAHC